MPQPSFADQVLVMVALQGMTPVTKSELEIRIELAGVQLSVAVATPEAGGLVLILQARFMNGGQVITGLTLSMYETVLQMESVHPEPEVFRQTKYIPHAVN